MKRRKYAREPLLYIHQPTVDTPTAPMQHSYTSTKKQTNQSVSSSPTHSEAGAKSQETIKKRPSLNAFSTGISNANEVKEPQVKKRRPSFPTQDLEEMESSSSSLEEVSEDNKLERKKFKEMTLMEKIDYFIKTPSHLPRMRCEVVTNDNKYRGIMLDKENEVIKMRVGRRTTEVSIEDITDIRLLGF
ncbi:CotO family spore coat protein [Ornithinibacillus sp. FSL M8-0202]|uniref:CotO family spore coat protein n=1 Tax=unclassified Ornithinibacillus TaxID=2620869 RepID=UPI0030CCE61F